MRSLQNYREFNMSLLLESVTSDVAEVNDEVKDALEELGKEGANDNELKAAMILQAVENDGDIENVDIDRLRNDVREGMKMRGMPLNEDAEGIIHVLEVVGAVLGNLGLIEFICEKIEHATGKKVDPKKVQGAVAKIISVIKKTTGLPAKAIEKFFEFVGHKAGLSSSGRKGLELVGMASVIVFFMSLGIIHFPVLGTSVLMGIFSLTGLIGKATELVRIAKEIMFLISNAGSKEAEEQIEGVTPDELEKMAGANAI